MRTKITITANRSGDSAGLLNRKISYSGTKLQLKSKAMQMMDQSFYKYRRFVIEVRRESVTFKAPINDHIVKLLHAKNIFNVQWDNKTIAWQIDVPGFNIESVLMFTPKQPKDGKEK